MVRERIAQFLMYGPRNKVVFAPRVDACLKTLDLGYELANLIKDCLDSPHLPMIAEDCLNSLFRQAMAHDDVIGDYIAVDNWGILFEPSLKFNLPALFESFSKNNVLILIDSGEADFENFHLAGKHSGVSLPLGELHPYILS